MPELHLEQADEKQLSAEVLSMVWSPKMDLIAFSMASGGVALYRMTLTRVWSLDPIEEGVKVTSVCWRPDGRVLAVGYSSAVLCHLDLEQGEVIHTESLGAAVSCSSWSDCQLPGEEVSRTAEGSEADAEGVLPSLPPLHKHCSSVPTSREDVPRDEHMLRGLEKLTVLAVGTEDGTVTLLLHGILPFGRLQYGAALVPRLLTFSPDLGRLLAVCWDRSGGRMDCGEASGGTVQFEVDTGVLTRSSGQLKQLTSAYGRLRSHLVYLDRTIQAICEAWESVLLEIDSKMESYLSSLSGENSLAAEFIELLLLGVPSPEMERFLVTDLTDKGLKKLRHSVELSYANIESLVQRHLYAVLLHVADQLTLVLGMARYTEHFGGLGLDEQRVARAQSQAALFLVKADELRQLIGTSTRDFTAFFRWLYVVVLRLSEETVPADCVQMSQKEVSSIVEFISCNLSARATRQGVRLERVGSYLRAEPLPTPAERSSWLEFVTDSSGLVDWPAGVVPADGSCSLLQQRDALLRAADELFTSICACGSQLMLPGPTHRLLDRQCSTLAVTHLPSASGDAGFVSVLAEDDLQLKLAQQTEPGSCCTSSVCLRQLLPADVSGIQQLELFGMDSVAALVAGATPVLLQLQLPGLLETSDPSGSYAMCSLLNVDAAFMSISGPRRLFALAFRSHRRVRVYDMAEPDPEESALERSQIC